MKYLLIVISILSLASCVKDPVSNQVENKTNSSERYIFALCQGVWGYDNSKLTRIDLNSGISTLDFFSTQNTGAYLGNTANDIVAMGDTALVAISFTNTIESIRLSDGKSLGRIIFKDSANSGAIFKPRRIAIYSDTIAYVSFLNRNSIIRFNPKTLKISSSEIYSGAFPEGLAILGDRLFVANSGFGYMGQSVERASTISVFNAKTGEFIDNFKSKTNPVELIANEKYGKIYCSCYEVSADIKGYILEIDPRSFQINRFWKCENTAIYFGNNQDSLLFVNSNGLNLIELNKAVSESKLIIKNPNQNEHWFSCAISNYDNSFVIGNAKSYADTGAILRYDKNSLSLKSRTVCGTNPGKIIAK